MITLQINKVLGPPRDPVIIRALDLFRAVCMVNLIALTFT